MRHKISALLVLSSLTFSSQDAMASSANILQGQYKLKQTYAHGDPLPTRGPVFKVYSESADRYDFVGEQHRALEFQVSATAYCSSPRREGRIVAEVAGASASRSDRGALGRGVVARDEFRLAVPQSRLASFNAVEACNDGLRTLAAQTGLARSELLTRGFALRHEDVVEAKATAFCSGGLVRGHVRSDTTLLDVWVECAPKPGSTSRARSSATTRPAKSQPPATVTPLIVDRELRADPASGAMRCPATVTFSGQIATSRAGEVSYRYVGHDGTRSPIFTLRFAAGGVQDTQPWTIDAAPPAPAPGTIAIPQGDDMPWPRVTGWQRIEVTSPAGYRPGERAAYRIVCEPAESESGPAAPPRASPMPRPQ